MGKLKQAVISKIHGLPWEEARWIECIGKSKTVLMEEVSRCKQDMEADGDCDDECFTDTYLGYDGNLVYNFKTGLFRVSSPWRDDKSWLPSEKECKSITLSRVLQALDNMELYPSAGEEIGYYKGFYELIFTLEYQGDGVEVNWKLLKKDKSTATLEDQSPETIQALESIFLTKTDGYKK